MYAIEERYYKTSQVFLTILGLWPYQQSYIARIQKMLFSSILFTFIIVQFLAFFTRQFSLELILHILTYMFPTIIATTKYCIFVIKANSVKLLLEQIRKDVSLLKKEMEIEIIYKYADTITVLITTSIVICYVGISCFIMLQYILPSILNIILPLNTSRSLELITLTEYFVDREKYFWALLFHEVLTIYIGVTVLCSISGTTMMYILHACALFKVASYRIENAIDKNILAVSEPVRKYLLQQRVVNAVIIHRRAIRYIELWSSSFNIPFTILIIMGVSSLTINLCRFLQLITVMNELREIFIVFLLMMLHIGNMFVLNYGGEQTQNHGAQILHVIYNGLWYAAPLYTQKLLLILMQKATVKVTLECGSMFIPSFEGFVTLVRTAASYFTVLYSIRQ